MRKGTIIMDALSKFFEGFYSSEPYSCIIFAVYALTFLYLGNRYFKNPTKKGWIDTFIKFTSLTIAAFIVIQISY